MSIPMHTITTMKNHFLVKLRLISPHVKMQIKPERGSEIV